MRKPIRCEEPHRDLREFNLLLASLNLNLMRKLFIISTLVGLTTCAMAQTDTRSVQPEQKQAVTEEPAKPQHSGMTRDQINKAIKQLEAHVEEHKNDANFDLAAYQRRLGHLKGLRASDE